MVTYYFLLWLATQIRNARTFLSLLTSNTCAHVELAGWSQGWLLMSRNSFPSWWSPRNEKKKKKSGLWPKKAYAYLLTLFCEGCWTNLWNRAVFYNREKAEAAPVITLYVSSSSGIVPIWYRVTWDARHPMDLSPALRRHPLLMESNFLLLLVGLNLTSIYSV